MQEDKGAGGQGYSNHKYSSIYNIIHLYDIIMTDILLCYVLELATLEGAMYD